MHRKLIAVRDKFWGKRGRAERRERDGAEQRARNSIRDIDRNATDQAAARQSAEDAAAVEAGSPAEEGGEG